MRTEKTNQNFVRQSGFSYIGLLMLMVTLGITMAATSLVWHLQLQRLKEQQLLFAGNAIRKAIKTYYLSNPTGAKEYPPSLQALLHDKRQINMTRHLRRIYLDPMNIKQNWGIIKQNNRVIGVYSRSTLKPIKRKGFPLVYEKFENAKSYQDWKFIYINGED